MEHKNFKKVTEIILTLKEKVKCPLCSGVIQEGVELECTHKCCKNCFEEYKSHKQNLICPFCKIHIKKKCSNFKDSYLDKLGELISNASKFISEQGEPKNATTDDKSKEKTPETSRTLKLSVNRDATISKPSTSFKNTSNQDFNKLPSKRLVKIPTKYDCRNTKRVLDWLDRSDRHLNKAITIESLAPDIAVEDSLDLPSISQIGLKLRDPHRKRSQSLDVKVKQKPTQSVISSKKCRSLCDEESYTIEEIYTEIMVADGAGKEICNKRKQAIRNKNFKSKSTKMALPDSINGWNRIINGSKNIKKRDKMPKQLQITVQSSSPVKQLNNCKGTGTKGQQHPDSEKCLRKKKKGKENGSVVNNSKKSAANYKTLKSVDKIRNEEHVDIKKNGAAANPNAAGLTKSTSGNVEDVYNLPTQLTKERDINIPEISKVNPAHDNIIQVIEDLQHSLNNFISNISYPNETLSDILVSCFTNINAHITKIKDMYEESIIIEKVSKAVQTVETVKQQTSEYVQTDSCSVSHIGLQTVEPHLDLKQSSTKSQKTSNKKRKITQVSQSVEKQTQKRNASNNSSPKLRNACDPNCTKLSIKSDSASLLLCTYTSKSPSPKTKKVNRKLKFSETQSKKFKRIRVPNDSESDEDGQPRKKNRFVRDDLSIRFTETEPGLKSPDTCDKNDDYDKYLDEVLKKMDSPPNNENALNNANEAIVNDDDLNLICDGIVQKDATVMNGPEKSSNDERKYTPNPDPDILNNTNDNVVNDDDLNLVCEQLIQKEQVVLNGSKQPSNNDKNSIAGINRSQPTPHSKQIGIPETENIFTDNLFSNPEHLNKIDEEINNYEKKLQLDTTRYTDIVEDTLIENMTERLTKPVNSIKKKSLTTNNNQTTMKQVQHSESQRNITSILKEVNTDNVFEDDTLDEELAKFPFTDEIKLQQNQDHNKLVVLQNVKLKSQNKVTEVGNYKHDEVYVISDSNDEVFSDDEIIEPTPTKKQCLEVNRSQSLNIPGGNSFVNAAVDDFDLCLPPPPGFEDNELSNESGHEITVVKKQPLDFLNKSSLTPDRLSQLHGTLTEGNLTTNMPKIDDAQNVLNKSHNSSLIVGYLEKSIHDGEVVNDNSNHEEHSMEFMKGSNKKDMFHSTAFTENVIQDSIPISPISNCKTPFRNIDNENLIENTKASKFTWLVTVKKASKPPNIMSSTPNQKSILNYVTSSQGASQGKKPCVAFTRIMSKDEAIIDKLKSTGSITVSATFSSDVTHLVVLVDQRGCVKAQTAKYILAVAAGIWIVRLEWIEECLRNNRIVPEEQFEVLDVSEAPGPKLSRLLRISNPLLNGYKILCAPTFSTMARNEAENVVVMVGGEILPKVEDICKQKGKCLIISDPSATDDTCLFNYWLEKYKTVTVDIDWLFKSVGQYKLLNFRPYLLCSDDFICDLGYASHLVENVPFTDSENV